MERQGKGMDLFHSGVTLVMSDIEGLAALHQAATARCMGSALALHENALRSVLPKYCGYEVKHHTTCSVAVDMPNQRFTSSCLRVGNGRCTCRM